MARNSAIQYFEYAQSLNLPHNSNSRHVTAAVFVARCIWGWPGILKMMMNRKELVEKLKALGLPMGLFVVFGSGPLAAAGIRETNDIDLLVNGRLYVHMKENGWSEKLGANGEHMLENGDFEVSRSWKFGPYNPHFSDLYTRSRHL